MAEAQPSELVTFPPSLTFQNLSISNPKSRPPLNPIRIELQSSCKSFPPSTIELPFPEIEELPQLKEDLIMDIFGPEMKPDQMISGLQFDDLTSIGADDLGAFYLLQRKCNDQEVQLKLMTLEMTRLRKDLADSQWENKVLASNMTNSYNPSELEEKLKTSDDKNKTLFKNVNFLKKLLEKTLAAIPNNKKRINKQAKRAIVVPEIWMSQNLEELLAPGLETPPEVHEGVRWYYWLLHQRPSIEEMSNLAIFLNTDRSEVIRQFCRLREYRQLMQSPIAGPSSNFLSKLPEVFFHKAEEQAEATVPKKLKFDTL